MRDSLLQRHITTATDAAATVAVTAAASTWISEVDGVVSLLVSFVALIAGILSIAWHIKRLRADKEDKK